MMNINRSLKNERLMRGLTGLNSKEFNALLPIFSKIWQASKIKQHQLNSTGQRAIGGGRKGFLRSIPEKLFFILLYYKCYPTYDVLSFFYGCNRSNAFHRQVELSQVLELSLDKKLVLPKRQIRSVDDFLKAFPEAKEVFIDGTERPIQRPKDKKRQKDNYSGKKKRHTVKNLVFANKKKWVGFLGQTMEGKKHDFTLLKEQAPPNYLPKTVKKHLDLGFKGFIKQFPGHLVSMPKRKPRTKNLTEFVKRQNKRKSAARVLIENALAGVKRLRITTDVFRNKKKGFADQVMFIACGLWNYHLAMR